jgi:hypothetical protein
MFEKELKYFLEKFKCNTKLLEYIIECKKELINKNIVKYVNPPKIETSIKKYDNGKNDIGRYVINISNEEFRLYSKEQKIKIFQMVYMDINNFKDIFLEKDNFQMYFGEDNGKGKVYFDGLDICYESSGKIKNYNFIKSGWINVTSSENTNKISSVYKLISDKNGNLCWYGIGKDYITKYFRPSIYLPKDNFEKLNEQEKYEYITLYNWYNLVCPCCKDNKHENNGEEKEKTKEEIIKDIKDFLKN